MLHRALGAHDPDLVVVVERPVLAEAVQHLCQARGPLVTRHMMVQALQDLVDAAAHERLDPLGLDLKLVQVAVLEATRAGLEGREPRVAVLHECSPGGGWERGESEYRRNHSLGHGIPFRLAWKIPQIRRILGRRRFGGGGAGAEVRREQPH